MKKLTMLICVLAMLLALPGVASASGPEPAEFTITGYTIPESIWSKTLPSGRTLFRLTAAGDVTEYFAGTFTFDEWGIFDPVSGQGVNSGIMTITTDEGNVVIAFGGRSALYPPPGSVQGRFSVLYGTGGYSGLRGWGSYTGNAGFVFTVYFTGWFYIPPE